MKWTNPCSTTHKGDNVSTAQDFFNRLENKRMADHVQTVNGMTVLLTKDLEESIAAQTTVGLGSVFTKNWKLDELKTTIEKLEVTANQKIYESKVLGVSFNLIRERKEVVPFKKSEGAVETSVMSEGISKRKIDLPVRIEKFLSNDLHFAIRPIPMGEAIRDFSAFEDVAYSSKLFIVEAVKPGKEIKRWDDDLYIVVPKV
jgi:hypothetical protein